jgi:hypothetical protein
MMHAKMGPSKMGKVATAVTGDDGICFKTRERQFRC